MDTQTKLPVVHLELTSGVFKIKAEDAIYEIEVKSDSSLSQVVEKIVEKEVIVEKPVEKIVEKEVIVEKPVEKNVEETVPAEAEKTDPGVKTVPDSFYKEISEEMFNEIGKMARELSISIKTPLDDDMKNVDITQAGVDLESAKGKLQDIVKMTEKATMDIMDISENIQSGCDEIQKHLSEIQSLDFVGKLEKENREAGQEAVAHGVSTAFIEEVIGREQTLKAEVLKLVLPEPENSPEAETASEPEPPAEPETKMVKVYNFDIDVVFQTLYELCTNEQVKGHIKAMRTERDEAFVIDSVLKAFSDAAPGVDVEDNFFNFSLPDILKILFQNSNVEKYKKVLKKMHQSAANIFLDQTLPIEGTVEEQEVAVAPMPEPAAVSQDDANLAGDARQALVQMIDQNIEALKDLQDKLASAPAADTPDQNSSKVRQEDHQKLISAIEATDLQISNIITNISRILESLSFQDLSGQQIKKILSVLSNVQVQLLSMLVTFGVKLKKKESYEGIENGDSDNLASLELDKLKSKVSEEWDEEEEDAGRLDQDAVDNLLAELGF